MVNDASGPVRTSNVPQPGADDPAPVVVGDDGGAHHVVVGSRYLRIACGEP